MRDENGQVIKGALWIRQDDVAKFVSDWLFSNPPTIGLHQMEELTERAGRIANETVQQAMTAHDLEVIRKIEAAKADMMAHLPLIMLGHPAPLAPSAIAEAPPVQTFELGDAVKVWSDTEHKAFRLGKIVGLHDRLHAYDVKLDDGSLTKISADGLAEDTRREDPRQEEEE
jgi:hypothetical protein